MSYKNRLLFAYYNILRFYYFKKSLQSIAKTWQVLKSKKNFVLKDVQIPISRRGGGGGGGFSIYRHHLWLEIPFSDHVFPKISKYRTENLHFPSTGKYYATTSPLPLSPPILSYCLKCRKKWRKISRDFQRQKKEN